MGIFMLPTGGRFFIIGRKAQALREWRFPGEAVLVCGR